MSGEQQEPGRAQDEFAQLESWQTAKRGRRFDLTVSSSGMHTLSLDGLIGSNQTVMVEATKRRGSAITASGKVVRVATGTPIRECIRLALDRWWMLYGEDAAP